MNRMPTSVRLGVALICLAAAVPAAVATPIASGQGLDLSQVDLSFPGVSPQPASQYGLAAVNVSQVLNAAGLPSGGFLNIATAQGWVVQNLPVDPNMASAGYAGLSMMFDLGASPGRITSLTIAADISPTPVTSFAATPATNFIVGRVDMNAQGGIGNLGGTRSGPTDHRITPATFAPGGQTFAVWQPRHGSVEQAINQCGPASLANSFQYLEDRYGVTASRPHADIPGVGGVPPNSRVAQFDQATGRAPGAGITEGQFFRGKTQYIQDNGLAGGLVVKSYGASAGDQTLNGVVIDDQTNDGLSLVEWLLRELAHGEDVELWLDWDGGGAHLVDLVGGGMVAGTPWFAWVHDLTQGDNTKGTAYNEGGLGISYFDATTGCWNNYVGDGLGVMQIQCAKFRFAASESVPEPGSLLLLVCGLLGLVGAGSRKRARQAGAL